MNTNFRALPAYARIGAVAAVAAAFFLVVRVVYLRPQVAALDEKRAAVARKQAELAQTRREQAELARWRSRVDASSLRLGRLDAVLPEPEDVSALLRSLQVFATESNLTIRAFRPQPAEESSLYAAWSYRLQLEGAYHDLARFFARIGGLARIVTIDDVVIRAADARESDRTIVAECTAAVFVLPGLTGGEGGRAEGP